MRFGFTFTLCWISVLEKQADVLDHEYNSLYWFLCALCEFELCVMKICQCWDFLFTVVRSILTEQADKTPWKLFYDQMTVKKLIIIQKLQYVKMEIFSERKLQEEGCLSLSSMLFWNICGMIISAQNIDFIHLLTAEWSESWWSGFSCVNTEQNPRAKFQQRTIIPAPALRRFTIVSLIQKWQASVCSPLIFYVMLLQQQRAGFRRDEDSIVTGCTLDATVYFPLFSLFLIPAHPVLHCHFTECLLVTDFICTRSSIHSNLSSILRLARWRTNRQPGPYRSAW